MKLAIISQFSLIFVVLVISNRLALADNPNLVLVVSRHGARAPEISTYDQSWGDQYGQLTKTGVRQHYLFGAALAAKYGGGALMTYTPSSVYLRAHSLNRTVQSLYAQALGLFPPGTGPVLSNGTIALDNQLQPFPVHSMNVSQDYLLDASYFTVCPIEPYLKRNQTDPEPQEIINLLQPTITNLSQVFGRNLTLTDLYDIYDTLRCDYYENKSFPSNLSFIQYGDGFWNNLSFAHDWWFMYGDFLTLKQNGLYSTNLLHEITSRFNNYLTQGSAINTTFLSYVGHDTTLAPILALFNVTTYNCIKSTYLNGQATAPACYVPKFASSLRFELYKVTNASDSYIKVFYDDNEINLCANQQLPCTVQIFNETVENLTNGTNLTGYYQQCYEMQTEHVDEGSSYRMILWTSLGVNCLLILSLIFACIYRRKLQTSAAYDAYYSKDLNQKAENS